MESRNTVQLKYGSWFSDKQATYNFPENWDLHIFSMMDSPVLDSFTLKQNLDNPIGSQRIQTLAKPGMKILFLCDDISRPTRTDIILPIMIESLVQSGVRVEDISILLASGTHDLMTDSEIDLKIGKEIVSEVQVFRHNCKKGNVFVGRTSQGTPVYVNKRVVESDLVIGIGGIYPHDPAGFSGGAKLILGVCGLSTILHFHRKRKGGVAGGEIDTEFRRDLLDAARLAKLDFIVNMLVNPEREIIYLVAGDVDAAFREAIRVSRRLLGVPGPDREHFDLVIADAYPIDSTYAFMRKGWWPVIEVKQNCHRLIIAALPKGIGRHLIFSVPGTSKKNKIKLLFYEFKSFGIGYFLRTLKLRFASILRKVLSKIPVFKKSDAKASVSHQPGSSVISGGFAILHHTNGEAKQQLTSLPHRIFDDMEEYIKYVDELAGHRPLKVAIYKNSSLTFPIGD